jgi:hypothetical protein
MKSIERTWLVGQNESSILGEGWYDRWPDWFGLPFRESFGRATLRIPGLGAGMQLTLLLGSALALHTGSQEVKIHLGKDQWEKTLVPAFPKTGWQAVTLEVPGDRGADSMIELVIETRPWCHGKYEDNKDFREVGILLGAVFVTA